MSKDEVAKRRFPGNYAKDITMADINNNGLPEFVCIELLDPYVSENLQWGETGDEKMSVDIWRLSGDTIGTVVKNYGIRAETVFRVIPLKK